MTQSEANVRAREIAESVHGTLNWNLGGWPTNAYDAYNNINWATVNNSNDLTSALSNGPVYAYYSSNTVAHMIVVTGVVLAPGHNNLVTTNNPWGDANIQTYNEFSAGIPGDTQGMILKGIIVPN